MKPVEICRLTDDGATDDLAVVIVGTLRLNAEGKVEMEGFTPPEARFFGQFRVFMPEIGPISAESHPRAWLRGLVELPEDRLGHLRFARYAETA